MRDRGEMPAVGELYYRLLERIEDFPEGEGIVVAGGHGKSLSTDGIRRAIGITDGRGMFFISHIGEVYPSGFLPIVAGNVRNTSLKEIYYSSEIFVNLRDPDRLKGKCGRCEYRKICGGSRARAYAVHGDYLAEEPCCIYIPQSSR
ncbi:SPASM domain-containing protein [Archaeoglobus fulgidus]|nr:SPASM domain-containing protein [Archaeoglobus fulgidus]